MRLVVISPESCDEREIEVLGSLMALGLERYHVRKPHWSASELASWLGHLQDGWRPRIVLHQHHELVERFGLGGRHWRDVGNESDEGVWVSPRIGLMDSVDAALQRGAFTSRSCHELATLRAALGRFDSVFLSPVFPSLSKPGYGPGSENRFGNMVVAEHPRPAAQTVGSGVPPTGFSINDVMDILAHRAKSERHTSVFALGGVTMENMAQVRALGFDGAAVLGAVWQAADPVAAFLLLQAKSEALRFATTSL